MNKFVYNIDDKDIIVEGGPYDLFMRVDYDDVNHAKVFDGVEDMVKILNAAYSKKK